MSRILKEFTESNSNISNSKNIIWPEWSNEELNKENWGFPKNGSDELFLDTEPPTMPPSLKPHEWIRAQNLQNLTESLTVFVASEQLPDLFKNNAHLLHSEFMRCFILSIFHLYNCGQNGLEISGESGNFIWNERNQSWKGWMHVYSMNKAGKGVEHRPIVNLNGKYVVRLFFMGSWRRIVIDDMIPVDEVGNPLLPRTSKNFELWPMLICKASLKLCPVFWSGGRKIADYYPITYFTGWTCLKLNVSYLSAQDKWDLLRKYAEHFEWHPEAAEVEDHGSSRVKTNSEERKPKETSGKMILPNKSLPVTLFVGLEDMSELDSDAVPGLSPCWQHFVSVVQSRDIPLDPKDEKPPLARWKAFRWIKWAISKGIINPNEYFVPIRYLKIISPLKRLAGNTNNIHETTQQERDQHLNRAEQSNQKSEKDKTNNQTKSSDSSINFQRRGSKEDLDFSFWCDFNKMYPFIKDIFFFYKLEYFPYTVKMSNTFLNKEIASNNKGSQKSATPELTTIQEPEFIDTYKWPGGMSKSRNEPLYFYCDTVENKFYLISFSILPNSHSKFAPFVKSSEDGQPIKEHYLTVEKHSWFYRSTQPEPLVRISTSGTKSAVLELGPGRHLLRIYCRAEYCFITISSDAIFHVGDRLTIYRLMSAESERIKRVVKDISDCVINAYRSFGTENYGEALRLYYKSYSPETRDLKRKKDKIHRRRIHEYFAEEQVQFVRKLFAPEEAKDILRSLRIFFLNPSIGLERFDAVSVMLKSLHQLSADRTSESRYFNDSSDESYLEKYVEYNSAAARIQAFFKMALIKKYKDIHDPSHEQHRDILDCLGKLAELFDYEKRESLAHRMLRNVVKKHERFYEMYPFAREFEYVLQVKERKGTLANIKTDQWLPILRATFNSKETETAFVAINVFVNLPRFTVRVFNNETGGEMFRSANNVVPTHYHHLKAGYTIIAYGWSDNQKFVELTWTLSFVTIKGEPGLYLFLDAESPWIDMGLPNLTVDELSNIYIPNAGNSISKWIVKTAKSNLVSFRFETSYEMVELKFRITDEDGNILTEVNGKCAIILPAVYLEHEEEYSSRELRRNSSEFSARESSEMEEQEKSKIFYVEAFVVNDSWPLTKSEWGVVAETKAKMASGFMKTRLSSAKMSKSETLRIKRGSKQSVDNNQVLEKPFWILQVVTDAKSGLEMSQDKSREIELAKLKEAWSKENPESFQRGKELREEFLNKYALKASSTYESKKSSTSSNERLSRSESGRSSTDSMQLTREIEIRTLKPPQSYDTHIQPLDLSLFLLEEDEVENEVQSTYSEEELKDEDTINEEDVMNLLNNQKKKYGILFKQYKKSFWERRALLEEVYQARKIYETDNKSEQTVKTVKGNKKRKKT